MGLLVDRVVADYYQTNCWIIAPGPNRERIIVDPGIAIPSLNSAIAKKTSELNLKIGAVIITHGHLDHTFSLISATKDFVGIDCYVHELDRDLLTNPERAMGAQSQALVTELKNAAVITDGGRRIYWLCTKHHRDIKPIKVCMYGWRTIQVHGNGCVYTKWK